MIALSPHLRSARRRWFDINRVFVEELTAFAVGDACYAIDARGGVWTIDVLDATRDPAFARRALASSDRAEVGFIDYSEPLPGLSMWCDDLAAQREALESIVVAHVERALGVRPIDFRVGDDGALQALTLEGRTVSVGPYAHGLFRGAASMPERWMTTSEVAKTLGVSPTAVRQLERAGKIAAHRTSGNHRRFLYSDVVRLLRERQAGL